MRAACDCSGLAVVSYRSEWPPRVSLLLCKSRKTVRVVAVRCGTACRTRSDCTCFLHDTGLLLRMDEQWDTDLAPTTRALLHELGRHYAPFLVANAEALARGEDRLECTCASASRKRDDVVLQK